VALEKIIRKIYTVKKVAFIPGTKWHYRVQSGFLPGTKWLYVSASIEALRLQKL